MRWWTGFLVVWMGFGAALTVAAVAMAVVFWPRDPPRRSALVPGEYTVHGIDVSHHQGRVDWASVAGSGQVDFVFLKATEGRTHVDRRFAANWAGAREAELPVGAYHYFSACRTGAEQAAHFISVVPREPAALPPVLDVEEDGRCNRGDRLVNVGAEVQIWMDRVGEHYGVDPLLYSTDAFARRHLQGIDAPRWSAAYSKQPLAGWVFWQHSDRGRVPGIRGPVDLNVFVGAPGSSEDGVAFR